MNVFSAGYGNAGATANITEVIESSCRLFVVMVAFVLECVRIIILLKRQGTYGNATASSQSSGTLKQKLLL